MDQIYRAQYEAAGNGIRRLAQPLTKGRLGKVRTHYSSLFCGINRGATEVANKNDEEVDYDFFLMGRVLNRSKIVKISTKPIPSGLSPVQDASRRPPGTPTLSSEGILGRLADLVNGMFRMSRAVCKK